MKNILFAFGCLFLSTTALLAQTETTTSETISSTVWLTDFETAKAEAAATEKSILLVFSGSDWCAPCIKLKKSVFGTAEFKQLASEKFVLLLADFPRRKKNRLDKAQQTHNNQLAERYNTEGKFPLTVLLDASGVQKGAWIGTFDGKTSNFTEKVKASLAK